MQICISLMHEESYSENNRVAVMIACLSNQRAIRIAATTMFSTILSNKTVYLMDLLYFCIYNFKIVCCRFVVCGNGFITSVLILYDIMVLWILQVLPVVVFFSSIVSVLYYCGVMQFIIRHVARFLAFCLGTSPAESLNAAGNIFIGQVRNRCTCVHT